MIIRTASDSWADQANPGVEHGDAVRLGLNGPGGTNDRQAFIHFALPAALLGSTVLSAKLRVFTRGSWAGSQTLTAERVTQKWAEKTLNWNNRPSVTATNSAAIVVASAVDAQQLELDVGAMLADVAAGSGFFGFRLSLGSDVTRWLRSAEAKDARLRPQLELVYSIPPDAPTPIGPTGGRAVSIALPTMRWNFKDRDVGSAQASYEVQLDDAADFASPLLDTGKLAGGSELWLDTFTINVNDVRYWRVRVWDDADVVSAWSDAQQFTRKAKGSLVLSSPGATVDDLSPPIAWTFTPPAGATQEAYRVMVWKLETGQPDALEFDTGKIASTSTNSVTLPENIIDIAGVSFRAEVRIWDTIDRDNFATDPDYVVATQVFSYVRSGAPTQTTGLTAAQTPTNGPGVLLTWQRATQPDYFSLVVDGVNVPGFQRLDPADLFVSGTTYQLKYWGATPRVSHTYEIEAVVLSAGHLQHSDGNATASFTVQLEGGGVWLVDEEDGTIVRVAGSSGPDLSIGESGTTHFLRGRRDPVRIVDTVRGYEGDVAGLLRSKSDRDTFLALYGRLTPLRLIAGDLNIIVELEGASTGPTHVPHDRVWTCAFGVLQVDDFTFTVTGG